MNILFTKALLLTLIFMAGLMIGLVSGYHITHSQMMIVLKLWGCLVFSVVVFILIQRKERKKNNELD